MDGVWGRARRSSRGLRADRRASAVHVPGRPGVGPWQVRAAAGAGQLVAGAGTGAVKRSIVRPAVSTARTVTPPLAAVTSRKLCVETHLTSPTARRMHGYSGAPPPPVVT